MEILISMPLLKYGQDILQDWIGIQYELKISYHCNLTYVIRWSGSKN